ncbi:class I adenylate-forming enzyme family protein [Paenibacillus sp. HB172176]|uniref:class I adenylate-forming enzyme family protein n=1 Tax=Paenibacillus sp. HB172176 TaxID=2493690 RepID=UPI001439AF05|nr:class I adenylate-forming enzyme family protein [Paenibacillus sp. HB172176]
MSPGDNSLALLFKQTARADRGMYYDKDGEMLFIRFDEQYRESLIMSEQIQGLGMRPRFIAAIWMEPSPACFRAIMAVVLAGGIPVPLHAHSTAAETLEIMHRLEADLLILTPSLLTASDRPDAWQSSARQIIHGGITLMVGETGEEWEGRVKPIRRREWREYTPPEETAVIFMSSGSTGTPKGIMLSFHNLWSNLFSIHQSLQLDDSDSVMITKSLGYCSTLTGEWLLALHAGMNISLSPGLTHPLQLIAAVRRMRPTFLCAVPAVMLPLIKSTRWRAEDMQSLKKLIVVGAAMPPSLLLLLQGRLPKVEIMPCYGLTEAAPRVTCLPAHWLSSKPESAGRAVPGVELAVYRDGKPLPAGEVGEIVVKGANVMLGYYNDEPRTTEVMTPYGLRTMDKGWLDEDGCLFVTGRADNAFNVAGHLFHPEMLENVLLSHPAIREAAAAGVPDDATGYRPIAFIVPEEGGLGVETTLLRELRDYCHQRLAAAGRPKEITVIARLPRTKTGKLDRMEIQRMVEEEYDVNRTRSIPIGENGH